MSIKYAERIVYRRTDRCRNFSNLSCWSEQCDTLAKMCYERYLGSVAPHATRTTSFCTKYSSASSNVTGIISFASFRFQAMRQNSKLNCSGEMRCTTTKQKNLLDAEATLILQKGFTKLRSLASGKTFKPIVSEKSWGQKTCPLSYLRRYESNSGVPPVWMSSI